MTEGTLASPPRTAGHPNASVPSARTARLGALALAAGGVLFVVYPAIRPWTEESTMAGAAAFASSSWIAAHLSAVLGFILLGLGVLALRGTLRGTGGDRLAGIALVLTWTGVGLTVLYFGAEIFGLHAVGLRAVQHDDPALLTEMTESIRFNATAITAFAAGLLLLAAGTVTAAAATWRSGVLPRWSGVPFAVGFALFLPQFFGTPAIRIAHGVFVGLACVWFATALWRARTR